MNADHDRLRALVLGWEELEPGERAQAEAHLAACEACRALLEAVRERERLAAAFAAPATGTIEPPDAESRAEADRSLAALRARLGVAEAGVRRPAASRPGRGWWARWWSPGSRAMRALVPAAAAAALAIAVFALWPRGPGEAIAVRGLGIAARSIERGAARAGWHTGDAFELRFELGRPAYVVVLHLGPGGRPALLHPAEAGGPVPRLGAGPVRLPEAERGIEWRFVGDSGPETFLVATSERDPGSVAPLMAEVERLGAGDRPRARLVRDLEALLSRRLGPVRVIEVEHLP
jgi:hypothetical protein